MRYCRYVLGADNYYRLQTVRYESLELTEELITGEQDINQQPVDEQDENSAPVSPVTLTLMDINPKIEISDY